MKNLPWKPLGIGTLAAIFTAYVMLSGFFTNLAGPLGYFQTFAPWLHRASGAELHVHSWSDYLERYFYHAIPTRPVWTEGIVLILGVLGAILSRKTDYGRFLIVFTLILLVGYSVIPYKTPWCGLNFLVPLIFLAGIGANKCIEQIKNLWTKGITICILLSGIAHYAYLSYQTNFIYFNDTKNPYVYSPTLPDVKNLGRRMEEIARIHPGGLKMPVKVISRDGYYWPLPWYLRRLENTGYWSKNLPADPNAPVLLASPRFETALHEKLPNHRILGMHGLRIGVFYELFVEKNLWDAYRQKYPAGDDEDE